jgi:hypothetical protein
MQAEAMLSLGSNDHLPDNTAVRSSTPPNRSHPADRIHSDFYRRRLVAAEV